MNSKINIVIVEDNPEYRKVLEKAIAREEDMNIVGKASTAERALSMAQPTETQQAPDLILLDLKLPGMSGIEAIPRFKKLDPNTKIIILTQSDGEADVLNAISQGANGYLLKTASIQQIKEGIRTVIRGGSSLDPDMATFILNHLRGAPKKVAADISLTERELEILELLSAGLVKKEIAAQLNISFFTVSSHVRHIYEKLEVPNAPSAISKAHTLGLFPLN